MKIIALANQKGGCGKTTSAVNIAARLNELGYKVLAIDLDPQSNLTICYGLHPDELPVTITDLFRFYIEDQQPRKLIHKTTRTDITTIISDAVIDIREGLALLPADELMEGIDFQIVSVPVSRDKILEKIIKEIVRVRGCYDYVIIDCRPSLSTLTINAMTACNSVIVPIKVGHLDYAGFNQLYRNVQMIKEEGTNPEIKIQGVFLTMYDSRTAMSREIEKHVNKLKSFNIPICKTNISHATALADASGQGQDIFTYCTAGDAKQKRKSIKSVMEYKSLVDELLQMEV